MVDVIFASCVDYLVRTTAKSVSRAFEDANLVHDDHLREFKVTLSLVKAMLLDADQKQEHNHELQEWLRLSKRVLYDAEDVLDEFESETLRKQVVEAHATTKDKVGHFFSTSNPLVFRHRMAQQIKDVIKRLDKVAADRHKFGLQRIDVDRLVLHRRELTHSYVTDSNVIGREHDKERIIDLLMQQNPNDHDDISLSVIPIVGMGGLGKTTLAKFVFNDKSINMLFPLKMWACVSNDFDIKKLFIKIICSDSADPFFELSLNQLDLEQLQNQLTNKIADKKFFLVLDDVWNEDCVQWIELKNILELGAPGSKILVTTRSQTIASMMGTVPSHILEGLSQQHSFSLFVKWVFRKGEREKYPHLIKIGREILNKCSGVPLAVRTIVRLLFSKFEANEWIYVRDNELWNIPQEKDDIIHALKLSYDRMPSYLKQCFALFSLYPKDYKFHSFEVSSLWGALGLLDSPNKNLEDVANKYLYELQSRSFLHDFVNLGSASSFKIHDLVHDLACFVAKEECLFVNSHNQNIPDSVLHLSFAENTFLDKLLTTKSVHLRTILFPYVTVEANDETLLDTCVSKFKFLRILDLSSLACETLPRHIGKLKHLRYLSIRSNHNIKRLPDSICELHNLQVLKLDGCIELEELPKGLRKLTSLRLLEITTKQFVLPDNDIANLSSLTFLCIASSHNLESIFKGVKFPSLKSLSVFDCQRLKSLQMDVQIFPELETFIVEGCANLDLQMWRDHHEEQSSKLKLTYVHFSNLPQLVTLPQWLQETVNSLQTLVIKKCENLEMFPEWLLTLANVKTLAIINCPKLLSLPGNIHNLTSLENLRIHDCPELCRKYQACVGEFWPKISHIKDVVIGEP
ncbi:hypothetical protein Fmac_029768 [Flemingia macrophylla]|uniref:Uncharacterized protein n=1 Tax=Flemingia macrophylla TaxID=520843 RepID=A0ABD1LBA7_9FABA